MFEDTLVESSGRLGRRGPWTTTMSFGLQLTGMAVLIVLPLLVTQALPNRQLVIDIPAPPPASAPVHPANQSARPRSTNLDEGVLRMPAKFPAESPWCTRKKLLQAESRELQATPPEAFPRAFPAEL